MTETKLTEVKDEAEGWIKSHAFQLGVSIGSFVLGLLIGHCI